MAERKKRIILDCDLMKHPHSGLYHYCLNLGKEVQELLKNDETLEIALYVPRAERNTFGAGAKTIIEKKGFRYFFNPVVKDCSIWHAPFQSGRILPDKRKYPDIKILLTIHDLNPLHEGKSYEEQRKSLAHTQTLIDKSDALVCISDFTKNAGDLPNLFVHADGSVEAEFFTTLASLSGAGERANILDADGAALVIHENRNDHASQPIGGAGGRFFCGVIGAR